MIRWFLDPIAHGPLVRARILADDGDGTKRAAVGSAIVTRAQLDDLTARLSGQPDDTLNTLRIVEAERDALAAAWRTRLMLEAAIDESTLPCARCGKPVPAGQATHADCQPIQCLFCTQCGRRLGAEERAAGCRVCLVSCAPLTDGIDAATDRVTVADLADLIERVHSAEPVAVPGMGAPYCSDCNYDLHRCPGCGTDVPHGTVACGPCSTTEDRHHADPNTGDTCTMPDCQRPECLDIALGDAPVCICGASLGSITTHHPSCPARTGPPPSVPTICPTGLACFGCRLCEASRQRAELEPGESEGPDIATSTTIPDQPTDADEFWPPKFIPDQRQGGA